MEEDFEIEVRYAQIVSSFTVTMMFSTGMPLLYPIFFFQLIVLYWVDKFICKLNTC
jgi:hypothetical protein